MTAVHTHAHTANLQCQVDHTNTTRLTASVRLSVCFPFPLLLSYCIVSVFIFRRSVLDQM